MKELQSLQSKIEKRAQQTGRDPKIIRLIAVSKGQPLEKMKEAYTAGQRAFGENYVQEWLAKKEKLEELKIEWHFLGHLQRNKVGRVANQIDWLHSLDSLSLARVLQEKLERPLPTLLEIKLSADPYKTGLLPEEAFELVPKLKELSNIDLKGLMTIPDVEATPLQTRETFQKLFRLLKEINQRYLYPNPLTELSMGMSHDFEMAIEEGATMIRIGEALFGPRARKGEKK